MLPVLNQTHQSALFCDMTVFSPEERERHVAAIRQMLSAVREAQEIADGYALRFAPDTAVLLKLAEFITGERLCCPFLSFDLRVEAEGGPVWLRLTGPEGVKEFLRMELSGFGGDVTW
ncbi:MAG: hypothetical protein ACRD9Y_05430 [Blastocatellia bacterium]